MVDDRKPAAPALLIDALQDRLPVVEKSRPELSIRVPSGNSRRGFASLSPERRREIASMGGKALDSENRSFSQSRELAAAAGRKGGKSARPTKRSFYQDRELAAAAGRKGGLESARRRSAIHTADDPENGAGVVLRKGVQRRKNAHKGVATGIT